jgi:hypothetical protein
MGNRAIIAFKEPKAKRNDKQIPCIYLHWNGGRDSVESFLEAARRLDVRSTDQNYSMARLTQIISNYIGGTLSIGCSTVGDWALDFLDNGVYWVDNLEIYDRTDTYEGYEEQKNHNQETMVQEILEINEPIFGSDKS